MKKRSPFPTTRINLTENVKELCMGNFKIMNTKRIFKRMEGYSLLMDWKVKYTKIYELPMLCSPNENCNKQLCRNGKDKSTHLFGRTYSPKKPKPS